MKKLFFPMALLVALNIVSCKDADKATAATSTFNMDSVKSAIAASNKSYGECFAKGDSTGFVSHYTKDACIYVSNMPRMCSPAAIAGFFNMGCKMGIKGLDLTTEELIGGKDGVAEIGKYNMKDSAGNSMDKGKFIVVWKEEDGKWKMHRDIWNSDMPPIK